MSKSNEADLQRKESIEKLQGQRVELLERLGEMMTNVMHGAAANQYEEEYKTLQEKISINSDQIKTLQALDPSQV